MALLAVLLSHAKCRKETLSSSPLNGNIPTCTYLGNHIELISPMNRIIPEKWRYVLLKAYRLKATIRFPPKTMSPKPIELYLSRDSMYRYINCVTKSEHSLSLSFTESHKKQSAISSDRSSPMIIVL